MTPLAWKTYERLMRERPFSLSPARCSPRTAQRSARAGAGLKDPRSAVRARGAPGAGRPRRPLGLRGATEAREGRAGRRWARGHPPSLPPAGSGCPVPGARCPPRPAGAALQPKAPLGSGHSPRGRGPQSAGPAARWHLPLRIPSGQSAGESEP